MIGSFCIFLNPGKITAEEPPPPVISRITIRNTDIFDFDTNVSLNKFPYTTINWIHIKTQEHVISNELLFKVGDKFDPFLVAETERNLRALSFIRAVRVSKFPQRDGTVVLVVHVNDAWTTEPQINLGGQNKVDTTEFGFKEKNLFGLGKTVGFFYERATNFAQREYNYFDPRLMGSRWQLKGNIIDKTDGETRSARIERPFYSADTKWTGRAGHEHAESIIDEFEDNAKVSRFSQTKETNEISAGTKVGGGRNIVNHAGLRWRKNRTIYGRIDQTSASRNIPQGEQLQTVFLDMDVQHNNFIEATHLEKMTRIEDINEGPYIRLSPGVSPRQLNGGKNQSEAEAVFEKRNMIQNQNMFIQNYTYTGRNPFENGENQRYGVKWKYYFRVNEFHTLVLQSKADWGDKLAPDNQVKLGGDNGLRAFKVDAIVGNKGWVFNAEDRMFFVDEIFSLLSLGGVVFYDTGYVWAQGEPVAMSKLRSDIGVGLRFGLTRSSNEVIVRLDLAYRTQLDTPDDSHFVVTFGTGQAF